MKKHFFWESCQIIIVIFSVLNLSNLVLYSQSVEADFLLYSPSPAVTGMGGAGAALPSDDPFNFFYNPAQLGLGNENTNLSIGFYPSSVNVSSVSDVLFNNFAVHGGYDCSKLLGGFPLNLGAGFLYQGIDFGEYAFVSDSGNIIEKMPSYEKAATFSLGFGFNYFIRIVGGISYKLIWSDMIVASGPSPFYYFPTKGNADAFDLGLIAELPILTSMSITENLSLNLSASAGYTFANWGSDMVYKINNSESGDPIARSARLGYGISTSIDYKYKETKIKLVKIDWTSEANDLLVKNVLVSNPPDTIYTQGYKPPLGDINFWDNVIMMRNTSTSAVNRHGVKFSFFETADIEFGRYGIPNIYNKITGSTLGFSVSTKGIMKILSQDINNNFIGFIAKHISLQYAYSRIKFDEYNDDFGYHYPSYEQSCNALYLTFSGF